MREVPERIKGSPGQGLHFSLEFLKIDHSSFDDLELKKKKKKILSGLAFFAHVLFPSASRLDLGS